MIINSKDDISKLFGEMTFKNNGRKLVNQNTYDIYYSDNSSSEDEAIFNNGND